jgi:2-iminobutanoate/2-iminopropanoate deaminase
VEKELIRSGAAPAGGPYSPALRVGDWIFLAGQGGADPATGELAESLEEQTEQALRNVAALLEAAGSSLANVVSCLVHLADLSQLEAYNAVYERHFPDPKPVRTTVGARLIGGMLVEITVVAHR